MAALGHPAGGRPFKVVASETLGTSRQFTLRDDVIVLPDGAEASYSVVTNPDSAFVVPHYANGDTVLVRQWRHAWDASSWEVPAGTFDGDEDPLTCARRELEEEAGLIAGRLTSLGVCHGAAFLTGSAHLFLGEELTDAARHPEAYEQDMEVLRIPFRDALEAALEGGIVHSGSVTALCRAARKLGLL